LRRLIYSTPEGCDHFDFSAGTVFKIGFSFWGKGEKFLRSRVQTPIEPAERNILMGYQFCGKNRKKNKETDPKSRFLCFAFSECYILRSRRG